MALLAEKYVGIILAMASSVLVGVSFIFTKKGLAESNTATMPAGKTAGETYSYLRNFNWWAGSLTMGLGEAVNFAAYSFAPAILVTPLGALSVLVSTVLASFFLKEKINQFGKVGCLLCLLGTVMIILHAPADKEIVSVEQIMELVLKPAFLAYILMAVVATLYFVYVLGPVYGKRTPTVYVVICSIMGSISVVACKAFGIALKLTLGGSNQFKYFSTYFFLLAVVVCALIQLNYLNRALELFSTNLVTPIYYVVFTTATILANTILFEGFNDAQGTDVVSIFCGFITIFLGIFLLNSTHEEIQNPHLRSSTCAAGLPTHVNHNWSDELSQETLDPDAIVLQPFNQYTLTRRSSCDSDTF